MIEELHQNLQTFVAGQFFVKIAVRFVSLGEAAKSLCLLFHHSTINLVVADSEQN
jgi:hypothetical protein